MDRLKSINLNKLRNVYADVKTHVLAKNDTEKRVYEALSNKNWGASSTLMNEISRDTYDFEKYNSIMKILWDVLDGSNKNWRQVFKGLTLLEHLIKNGSERCVDEARDNTYKLRSFSTYTSKEGNVEKGTGVREKSKQIIDLLKDDEYIREERRKARKLRDKYVGIGVGGGSMSSDFGASTYDGFRSESKFRDSMSSSRESHSRFKEEDDVYEHRGSSAFADDDKDEETERKDDEDAFNDREQREEGKVEKKVPKKSVRKAVKIKSNTIPPQDKVSSSSSQPTSIDLISDDMDFNPRGDSQGAAADSSFDPFGASTTTSQNASETVEFDAFASAPPSSSFPPAVPSAAPSALQPPQKQAPSIPPSVPAPAPPPANSGNARDPFGAFESAPGVTASSVPQSATVGAPVSINPFPGSSFTQSHQAATIPQGVPMVQVPSQGGIPLTPFNTAVAGSAHSHQQRVTEDNDFGDFSSATEVKESTNAMSKAKSSFSEFESLVDLSGLSINEKKKKAAQEDPQAFSGLDGFYKGQPGGMNMPNRPPMVTAFGPQSMAPPGAAPMQGTYTSPNYQNPPGANGMGMNSQTWAPPGGMAPNGAQYPNQTNQGNPF